MAIRSFKDSDPFGESAGSLNVNLYLVECLLKSKYEKTRITKATTSKLISVMSQRAAMNEYNNPTTGNGRETTADMTNHQ